VLPFCFVLLADLFVLGRAQRYDQDGKDDREDDQEEQLVASCCTVGTWMTSSSRLQRRRYRADSCTRMCPLATIVLVSSCAYIISLVPCVTQCAQLDAWGHKKFGCLGMRVGPSFLSMALGV
jgi:hypothetical protein